MDKKDKKLLLGIEQRKETSNKEEIHPHANQVNINGYTGYFEEWGNSGELDKKENSLLVDYLAGHKRNVYTNE